MRPSHQIPRDRLPVVLGCLSAVRAWELATALQVSTSTLHRMLAELGGGNWCSRSARPDVPVMPCVAPCAVG
ncbi:MAG: hypothetical protein LBS89_01950 [Zoogloeaceae bacterium]|nr:hypothetical protein [Zoogloeaceae bacterium]